jgi:hypothetical protein
MLLINSRTKQIVPLPEVLDLDRFLEDMKVINDAARGRKATMLQFLIAFARNYRFDRAPKGLGVLDLVRVVDGYNGAKLGLGKQFRYEWRMAMVAGMWFQDLFNYDFRRTEMCIIPYATQAGEISFCAYNTGVGWRQVVEKIFQTASTAQWFQAMGKHAVYAGGKNVPLPELALKNAPPVPGPARLKSDLPMYAPQAAGVTPRSAAGDALTSAPGQGLPMIANGGAGETAPPHARQRGRFDAHQNTTMSPFNAPSPSSVTGAGCASRGCTEH